MWAFVHAIRWGGWMQLNSLLLQVRHEILQDKGKQKKMRKIGVRENEEEDASSRLVLLERRKWGHRRVAWAKETGRRWKDGPATAAGLLRLRLRGPDVSNGPGPTSVLSLTSIYLDSTAHSEPAFWLPVGKSGYQPVTGHPEHPWETELPCKRSRVFLKFLNLNYLIWINKEYLIEYCRKLS
jgi:hypothetical protein